MSASWMREGTMYRLQRKKINGCMIRFLQGAKKSNGSIRVIQEASANLHQAAVLKKIRQEGIRALLAALTINLMLI